MYQYEELKAAAMSFDATKENRLALLNWFMRYDYSSWNGECFDLGDGYGLYPIYDDDCNPIDAEVR